MHKSAITDHSIQSNHVIDWPGSMIVDKESNKKNRWIREALWIRKSVNVMNRQTGQFQLSNII